MSVKGSEIILEEEELLAGIRQKIIENPESRGPSAVEVHNQMLVLRDEILDAKNEDLPALYDQLNHLSHLLTQLQNSRKTDEINPDMPYFAHLRLEEGGEVRDIFLGKATRLSNGLRIVDWRHAPISKIFYRYQEGEEYEEIIAGQSREGEVSARRILFIQRGELLRVSNSEHTWVKQRGNWRQLDPESTRLAGGEGQSLRAGSPLTSVLGSGAQLRASKHLPDIAALIDENQFELITAKTDGALVIRGSAGSGKTTVALHRIAYLAFHDTKRFRPQSIMFMVWGKAMRDYIRNVLPSLGVSGIVVNTWTRWSSQMVRQLFPMLSLPLADLTPDAVCQIKLHWRTEKRLAEHIATTRGRPTVEQAINDWLHVITDFAAIESDFEGLISPNLMSQARRWLEQQNRDIGSILEKEPEAQASLDQEDYALLLRAYQLRVGPLRKKGRVMSYSHIAIDEVQDFSPIEILILMDICDDAKSFTLAGDTRQHISKEAGFSSWSSFLNQVGLESSSLHTLDISYRSTHPITRFAVQLLEDNEEPLPTTLRDGPSVELFQFSEHGACLIFISEELQKLQMNEPFANVAILTPNADISQMYAAGLQDSDVHKVRLVQNQKFAFAPGIDVVEIDQVKGLEFDYVIVVEVSAFCYPDTSHNRRLLHVGATRAVHQLWLTSCATISPIIKEIL